MAEDDSMVKIIQSLGLDYSQAIQSTKAFEASIASLNKQLFEMKANALQGARDINQAFSSQLGSLSGGKTFLDQYGQPLKTIQTESAKVSTGMATGFKTATVVAKEHAQTVQDITKKYNLLASEMQRRNLWFISGGLFYGTLRAAQEAVQTISEVEMGVTQIARVMEDSSFVFKDYRDQLLQLGVEYGQTFETVQDIALRWAQAGYNVRDSLELTRTSLLALNTAELDASKATEGLIGIMAQWNLTSKDLPLVLDKINKTADDFTVTSQDLVDGLLRSSGAAKIMGLSIDQTIALLTVMREASGRTGREVGNALNSILSYIQRPASIKTLESLGIEVFADKAKTQFRNVMDIFQDIASQWPKLSADIQDAFVKAADDAGLYNEELANAIGVQQQWNDLQQRDISQAAAGVYRRNYFIAMIERLTQAQEVLNNMMDAAGYSQAENARTMDTLEKKYNSLKAAAQQLAVALGDAGLLDILKSLTDTATDVASAFAKMDDDTKALVLTALELLAAFKALQSVLALFGAKGIMSLAGSTAALVGLAPGIGQIVAAIAALTAGIGLLAYNLQKANAETLKDVNAKQQELEQTNNLINSYEMLKSKSEQTTEVKNQLLSIQKQLAAIYPEYVDAIDAEGNKLVTNVSLLKEMISLKQQELALKKQELLSEASTELPKLQKQAQDLENKIQEKQRQLASGDTKQKIQVYEWAEPIEIDITKQIQSDILNLQKQLLNVKMQINAYKEAMKSTRELSAWDEQAIRRSNIAEAIKAASSTKTSTTKGTSTVTATGGSGAITYTSSFDANIDRYMLLNAVLSDINNALALTDTLQNQVNDIDKIKYLENENALLRQQQNALHNLNEERRKEASELKNYLATQGMVFDASGNPVNYQEQLQSLAAYINSLSESTDAEKIARQAAIDKYNDIQDALEKYMQLVHTEIPQASNEWYELEGKIKDNQKAINDIDYSNAEREIEHWTKLGVYNIEQQIAAYKDLYSLKADSIEEEYRQTEKLFDLYKDLLSEEQKKLEEAYNNRLEKIDEEAERKKKRQQEIIDGIEKELDLLDRQESEYSYEQKIADLKEQLAYWSVRTSEEARQKVADINKQIDEAEHDREVELQRQKLEDKKKAAEDEIDAIEEAAREEREKLQKSYKLIEKAFDEHSINMIAAAGAMAKDMFEQVKDNYLKPLSEALEAGDYSEIEDILERYNETASSMSKNQQIYSLASQIVDLKRQYEVLGDKSAATKATSLYDELEELSSRVANNLHSMNYEQAKEYLKTLPKSHEGSKVLSYGAAYLAPGELIFPPDLSKKLEDLISALYAKPIQHMQSSIINSMDNRKIFNGPLFNVDNMNVEDEVDMQIISREFRRAIVSL